MGEFETQLHWIGIGEVCFAKSASFPQGSARGKSEEISIKRIKSHLNSMLPPLEHLGAVARA